MDLTEDLKLLGNARTQKLSQTGSSPNMSKSNAFKEAIQILEKECACNEYVQMYPQQFKEFLLRNVPEILRCFARTLDQ